MRWGDLVVAGEARRSGIRERHWNGVDAVEVRERGRILLVYFLEHAPPHLHPGNIRIDPPPDGAAVHAVDVYRAREADRELEDRLVVEVDRPGSSGVYRFSLVERRPDGTPSRVPHAAVDPRFAGVEFVFDIDAPRPPILRAPTGSPASHPDISYLKRDYQGLRELMLDRLSATLPAWTERHVPDAWIALIELLAYIGDDLSYYEDAVATEAYLQTARRRVSVRRHARLVDYRLHDGCAARAWVALQVGSPVTLSLHEVRFVAAGSELGTGPPLIDATASPPDRWLKYQQYSPLPARIGPQRHPANLTLQPEHSHIQLWNWGEPDSHLARGATRAVLVDGRPAKPLRLEVGDVLVLEESHDPRTGGVGPADPAHRQAVRLTAVRRLVDELYDQPLIEIRWDQEDALAFDLAVTAGGHPCACASGNVVLVTAGREVDEQLGPRALSLTTPGLCFSTPFPHADTVASHQAHRLRDLYDAWRDQIGTWQIEAVRGEPLSNERLQTLRSTLGEEVLEQFGLAREESDADEYEAPSGQDDALRADLDAYGLGELLAAADRLLAGRRRRLETLARLAEASGPLEPVLMSELEDQWGEALVRGLAADRPGAWGPASGALRQDPRAALPVLELGTDAGHHTWQPALDLIDAKPGDRMVVAEVDDDGIAALRLGAEQPKGPIEASYWVGNGEAGNAEAEAINAVLWVGGATSGAVRPQSLDAISQVRNPLPASGGVDAETVAAAKHAIPGSFRDHQPRALTADDYVSLASAQPGVRRAAAELRFTGTLTVVDVAVQPSGREDPDRTLLERVRRKLDQSRRIGHVVSVRPPRYRPLIIALDLVLSAIAVRATIADQLARLLSSGWQPDGSPALFNPVRLDFATAVYSSPVIAAVHGVDGVESAALTKFAFLGSRVATAAEIPERLNVGQMEIARLDNDPTAPEHGWAMISLEGGR